MCIVNFTDGSGIIFIHIPKNGGSSIENYFIKKYGLTHKEIFIGSDPRIPHSIQHCTWKEYCEHWNTVFCGAGGAIDNYDIITVVRNPYTRIISDFYWWMRLYDDIYIHGGTPPVTEMPPNEVTIEYMETFIENMLYLDTERVAEGTLYDTHPWPQWRFLDGVPLSRTTILRQEKLSELMHLCARLRAGDFSERENVNPNTIPYKHLLTPKIISMVNSVYSRDFDLFGYEVLDPEKDGVKQPADMIVLKRPYALQRK